jgi:hypothetical protein
MHKRIITLLIIIVVLLAALFAFNSFLRTEVVEPGESTIEQQEEQEAYVVMKDLLSVPDQASGSEIFVERAEFLVGGYIVIHRLASTSDEAAAEESEDMMEEEEMSTSTDSEMSETAPLLGTIIGVSDYMDAGYRDNFVLVLSEGETAEVDENLYAAIYLEKGTSTEMTFSADEDMLSESAEAVVSFMILDDEALPGFEMKL